MEDYVESQSTLGDTVVSTRLRAMEDSVESQSTLGDTVVSGQC
jgi:hypothetical protein